MTIFNAWINSKLIKKLILLGSSNAIFVDKIFNFHERSACGESIN